jgi:hypothetical protein
LCVSLTEEWLVHSVQFLCFIQHISTRNVLITIYFWQGRAKRGSNLTHTHRHRPRNKEKENKQKKIRNMAYIRYCLFVCK